MHEYIQSDYEKKHGIHSVVVSSDVDVCCHICITGDEDLPVRKNDKGGIPWIGVGMLRSFPYRESLCWRIKNAFRLLRGTFWACELEFYSRKDAERFITAFGHVVNVVFRETEDEKTKTQNQGHPLRMP